MTLHFTVMGKCEPAGSKRAIPGTRDWRTRPGVRWNVVDANPNAAQWKEVVAATARGELLSLQRRTGERIPAPLFCIPVEVTMIFRRQRPASHLNSKGDPNKEGLRHPFPESKPDVLKTARAVEDALTGIAYVDDALIVTEVLTKEWGVRDEVEVWVTPAIVRVEDADRFVESLHAEVT